MCGRGVGAGGDMRYRVNTLETLVVYYTVYGMLIYYRFRVNSWAVMQVGCYITCYEVRWLGGGGWGRAQSEKGDSCCHVKYRLSEGRLTYRLQKAVKPSF